MMEQIQDVIIFIDHEMSREDIENSYDIVEIEKSADLMVLARSAETSFKILQQLNPELRQSATPNESYSLKIPT